MLGGEGEIEQVIKSKNLMGFGQHRALLFHCCNGVMLGEVSMLGF